MTAAERKRKSRARGKGRQRGGITGADMEKAKRRRLEQLRAAAAAERAAAAAERAAAETPVPDVPAATGPVFVFATDASAAQSDSSAEAA